MLRCLLTLALLVGFTVTGIIVPGFVDSGVAEDKKPNVLFLAIDDLRPEVGCYGSPRAVTPNIDQLAEEGVRFDRAYVTYPLCLPSRASMLTGVRLNFKRPNQKSRTFADLINLGPTWPRTFRGAGYWTATSGKIYHGNVPNTDNSAWDIPGEFWRNGFKDWSPELMTKVVAEDGPEEVVEAFRKNGGGSGSLMWQAIDGDDDILTDGQTASIVIDYLRNRPKDRPFVICAGFSRPHMPWLAPRKYFDLYQDVEMELPTVPQGSNREILAEDRGSGVSAQGGQWNEGVSDERARSLIKGYLASVSYSDAQVGRILAELKRQGLEENTIVVLWGDHGYHLTDHGLWRKNTIYHIANRIPFIIRAPGLAKQQTCPGLVESIDIYPTLLELTGIDRDDLRLDGKSLVPLLNDPRAKWNHPAYISGGTYHGIVTDRYRFAVSSRHPTKLFDLSLDEDEWRNLANDPEYTDLVSRLTRQVNQVWNTAR